MGRAKRQRHCPRCQRLVYEAAETCPFCRAALRQRKAAQAQQAAKIKLRDVFPLLNYGGDPLPRGDRQRQPKTPGGGWE